MDEKSPGPGEYDPKIIKVIESNKFNNKTNGITQRRFLLHANPLLADWITEKIGNDWITNLPHLKNLEIYASDIVPAHVEQLKDYSNLHKRVWDCSEELPEEYNKIDLVLVEGAWYHLNWEKRKQLIDNLKKLTPNVIVIDWLSAWHDTTQRILQDKEMPNNITNPRPNEPFVFDTEIDLEVIKYYWRAVDYSIELFPVDMDLRFGYKDFNEVNYEEFKKFIYAMNENIHVYGPEQTFIMNATEHGCYIIKNIK